MRKLHCYIATKEHYYNKNTITSSLIKSQFEPTKIHLLRIISKTMSETNPVNEEVNEDLFDTQSILAELLAISNQNSSNSRFRSNVVKKKHNSESLDQTKQQQQHQRQQRQQKRNQTDDSDVENQNFEIKNSNHHDIIKRNNDRNAGEFFVEQYEEKSEMNQYWYSPATMKVLCNAMIEIKSLADSRCSTEVTNTFKIAFLSTPSLYFALPIELRKHCNLFDVSFDLCIASNCLFLYFHYFVLKEICLYSTTNCEFEYRLILHFKMILDLSITTLKIQKTSQHH